MVAGGDPSARGEGDSAAAAVVDPSPSTQPARSSAPGSTIGAGGSNAAASATSTAGWATSSAGSTSSAGAASGSPTTTISGIGYSQIAPITSTVGASAVTCNGLADGTYCAVAQASPGINSSHLVTCSTGNGKCTCFVANAGGPPNDVGTLTATFPFTADLCPSAALGTVALDVDAGAAGASVPASICSRDGTKLFALCGW